MSRQAPIEVVPSLARTATGTGSAFQVPQGGFESPADELAVMVDVTAVSGTSPSMTVSVEWSPDGTNWFTGDPADSFTAITAAGKKVKTFAQKAPHARIAFAISGTTPSFTFAVDVYPV